MTAAEIVAELEPLGLESYRKVMRNHGVPAPFFGVKIEDMKKKFVKRIKKDYQLALDLYDTGIYDAMYLAGLIADDDKMTKKDLQHWADSSTCPMISEYTVAWVASESKYDRELASKWIDSKKAQVASSGWATWGLIVAMTDDADLDMNEVKQLLERVKTTIHKQPNRVRYVMNGFVISVGCYVRELTSLAIQTAKAIGPVGVDMGDTSCKIPSAVEYIDKVKKRDHGKKRKMARC